MLIHLKKNEKIFINGAVIRLDRRGSIELLNDAQFLLASHIMQPEQATTPLRQIYFVVQTMLMDPANSELTRCVYTTQVEQIRNTLHNPDYIKILDEASRRVEMGRFFEALKLLRQEFSRDDAILKGAESGKTAELPQAKTETTTPRGADISEEAA